ncbi:autotransporter outer membrane beta-barrel domain-containing protein [uncultured Roseibium sp.]|uniref:autotransporter outer membrane beta-barrel domain-containing protein n=1 Tax=uncultured Roseibium sp. TaxID=1936171 RepID=UPI00262D700E|nr:autotransporter outer membrane beta-barrel domain-containing protein [uncultured Roseibium sp.]
MMRRPMKSTCNGPTFSRKLLLATATFSLTLVGEPKTVLSQTVVPPSSGPCTVSGTSATCTGDVSSGIDANSPLTSLTVENVTQDIAPASGVDGIEFESSVAQDITINSDTGSFSITATGGANGIDARLGTFSARVDGDISVTSNGNVTGDRDGINTDHFGEGTLSVTSTGNITAGSGNGIDASHEGEGDSTVTSKGNIDADNDGINAFNRNSGSVFVTSTGNIKARTDIGIDASAVSGDQATVTSNGNITAEDEGIEASARLNVTVTSTGNIVSNTEDGIEAETSQLTGTTGTTSVTSVGNITAEEDGITAEAERGTVVVNSTGDITASTGHGVQSIIGSSGSSTVNLNSGTVQGGTGSGSGVSLESVSGVSSTLNNAATLSAQSGLAVSGQDGDDTVNNTGTITGNVSLGAGANAFNNQSGGTFNSGSTVTLGSGNSLTNAGNLSPGGESTVGTTTITGNLIQTSAGTMTITVDTTASSADRLNVSGTATLDGSISPHIINQSRDSVSVTILSATGGTTNSGVSLAEVSPAYQAGLSFPNANDVVLTTSIDFSAGAGNANQRSIGDRLNAAFDAGQGGLQPILSALLDNVSSTSAYEDALDQLSAEVFLSTQTASLFAANNFSNLLFSCDVAGEGLSAINQGQCVWVQPRGRLTRQGNDGQSIGYDEYAGGIAGGAQVSFAPGWFAGVGLGYESASLSTDSDADSTSNRFSAGVSVKYQNGPLLLSTAISGGIDDYDTDRAVNFGGLNLVATSGHRVAHVAGRVRAAYLFERGNWFAKPQLDINVTHLNRGRVTESGGGAANLSVSGSSDTYYSITPSVELGNEINLSNGGVLRPFVRAGVSFYPDDDSSLSADFLSAPTGVGSFTNSSDFGNVFADVSIGATALFENGAALKLSYEGALSSDTQQHGFLLKGSLAF